MWFVATKTDTPVDDDLLERIEAVLNSPAGSELLDYVVRLVSAVSNAEVG